MVEVVSIECQRIAGLRGRVEHGELGELARRGLRRTLSWERYLVGPADDTDPAAWITEVVVPLPG